MARTAVLAAMLSGCYDAHGTISEVDAGDPPPPPPHIDDAGVVVMPPPPGCGGNDRVTVSIEQLGTRPCDPGIYPGSALYAVEPVPGGLRLRIDTCPNADDDCRCDVTVTGLQEGLHEAMATPLGEVTVQLGDGGVAIEQLWECEPGPEPIGCVPTLFFAAMDGLLESPPIDPESLDVRWAENVCSGPEAGTDCSTTLREMGVMAWVSGFPGAIGTEQIVVEGEPVMLDGAITVFHPIRTNVRSCPDARIAPFAAWAAWRPALDR